MINLRKCIDCKYVPRCENIDKMLNKTYVADCIRYKCYEKLEQLERDVQNLEWIKIKRKN